MAAKHSATERAGSHRRLPRLDVADVRGTIDCGIISIREDELQAVLKSLPPIGRTRGTRWYSLSRVDLRGGGECLVAMTRASEQGGGAAMDVARDVLADLRPRWLLVVGIAGGRPTEDFTLGDVVVSTRIHDFSVEAALVGGARDFNVTGGPLDRDAEAIAAHVTGFKEDFEGWNTPEAIGIQRPPIGTLDRRLEGSRDWRDKVKKSLAFHADRSTPLVTACAIAASDRLVRDAELLKLWLRMARHVCAIEMESQGVYRAAHGRVPFLAIRGISDIVGLKRDNPRWTAYACHTAASFTRALLHAELIGPKTSRPHRNQARRRKVLQALDPNAERSPSLRSTRVAQPASVSAVERAPPTLTEEQEKAVIGKLDSKLGITRGQALGAIERHIAEGGKLPTRWKDALAKKAKLPVTVAVPGALVHFSPSGDAEELFRFGIPVGTVDPAIRNDMSYLTNAPKPDDDELSARCVDLLRLSKSWDFNPSVVSFMYGVRATFSPCGVIGSRTASAVGAFLSDADNAGAWDAVIAWLPPAEVLEKHPLWTDSHMLLDLLQLLERRVGRDKSLPESVLMRIAAFAGVCKKHSYFLVKDTALRLVNAIVKGPERSF
jgi:nucleoside phosphorylase